MENADVFGSSTWHDFLERMRQPSAADFVKAIKSFIVSFLNNPPDPERDSAAVQEFLSNMEAAFRTHSLWAGCLEEELESAGEGLEKYVMTKLFNRVFASVPDDVIVDQQLHEKMALIQQFIQPDNLDIKPTFQNETSWLLAQKELQKINMYKAPKDKLVCILNCCKVINNLLHNASVASNENTPGADEFLPVLIYVTIKANPPQLHSNLLYIQRYRRQSRLVAETAYFFTNVLSAESFILSIDANSISMDETEYEKNMESARSVLSGLSADSENLSVEPKQEALNTKKHQDRPIKPQISLGSSEMKFRNREETPGKDQRPLHEVPSMTDLENKGASMLLKEDQASRIFRDFPYLFSQAGDLTVNDVEQLLNNYKQLVFKYVCLSKGLGVANPSPPLSVSQSQSQHQTENVKESEDSSAVSLLGVENSEYKIPQDESVESQSEGNDEISHS
nr:vacuolar protein sorting-associated protein 9A-like protein [Camellia sinensis]